jgi:hypothetical protein
MTVSGVREVADDADDTARGRGALQRRQVRRVREVQAVDASARARRTRRWHPMNVFWYSGAPVVVRALRRPASRRSLKIAPFGVYPFASTSAIAAESAVASASWFAWTYSVVCVDARSAASNDVVICDPAA